MIHIYKSISVCNYLLLTVTVVAVGNVGDAGFTGVFQGRGEEWDSFTVPPFARSRHFHGLVLAVQL
jgi:hypothetical protein